MTKIALAIRRDQIGECAQGTRTCPGHDVPPAIGDVGTDERRVLTFGDGGEPAHGSEATKGCSGRRLGTDELTFGDGGEPHAAMRRQGVLRATA